MLVLSRKKGERIQIAETITLTVVEVRGDRVRLGIEAPPEVQVWREELALSVAQGFSPGTEEVA
jgi:carbon storage regulator